MEGKLTPETDASASRPNISQKDWFPESTGLRLEEKKITRKYLFLNESVTGIGNELFFVTKYD